MRLTMKSWRHIQDAKRHFNYPFSSKSSGRSYSNMMFITCGPTYAITLKVAQPIIFYNFLKLKPGYFTCRSIISGGIGQSASSSPRHLSALLIAAFVKSPYRSILISINYYRKKVNLLRIRTQILNFINRNAAVETINRMTDPMFIYL